jgi:hypothetical protein
MVEQNPAILTILITCVRTTELKADFAGRCETESEPNPPPRLLVYLPSSRPAFIFVPQVLSLVLVDPIG